MKLLGRVHDQQDDDSTVPWRDRVHALGLTAYVTTSRTPA